MDDDLPLERAWLAWATEDDLSRKPYGSDVRRRLEASGYADALPAYERLIASGKGEWYIASLLRLIQITPSAPAVSRLRVLRMAEEIENTCTRLEGVVQDISETERFFMLPCTTDVTRWRQTAAYLRVNADTFDARKAGQREAHIVTLLNVVARVNGRPHYADVATVLTALGVPFTDGALEQLHRRAIRSENCLKRNTKTARQS